MLSATAEYALRAVVFLMDHRGTPHTADAISSVTKVPVGYLSKILQGLAKAGIISSQRGPSGGFTLGTDQEALTVLDVLRVVDPLRRIEACPLELAGHGTRLCPLHRLLDSTTALVEKRFADVTIASLLGQRRGSHPLCEFPRHGEPDPALAVRRG